jgi:uncharacterized protein (TIGR02145 family)
LIFNSCTEDDNTPPSLVTDSITDIDGNVYKTVKIGNTWWMAENLKTQRYRNGDSISFVPQNTQDTAWSNCKTGAYCSFEEKYGFLYNFYSISDPRGIAPQGWHIPDDEEWKELEMYLGMSQEEADSLNWRGNDQGNKLKTEGGNTTYWAKSSDQYTIFGTNESGFTAIGSACRVFNGEWGEITHTGFWWTASAFSENEAWYRGLDYDKSNVFRYYGPKNYGFSIRCVKD